MKDSSNKKSSLQNGLKNFLQRKNGSPADSINQVKNGRSDDPDHPIHEEIKKAVEPDLKHENPAGNGFDYRNWIEKSPESFLLCLPDGKILDVNSTACQCLGYSRSDLLTKYMIEIDENFINPDYLEKYWKSLKLNHPITLEGRYRRKDGSVFPVEIRTSLVMEKDRELVLALSRDISEKIQTGKDLKEREARFRDLANLLPQIVFEADYHGNFTFVNQAVYEMTGYTERDFLKGIDAFQIVCEADREKARRNFKRVLSGGKNHDSEYTMIRKNKSTFPVEVYSTAIIRNNQSVGLRGIVIDITERRQFQEETRIRARQQGAIAELGQYALGDPTISSLMQKIVDEVRKVLPVQYCQILEIQPDGESLKLRQGSGWQTEPLKEICFESKPNSFAGFLLSQYSPVIIHNLQRETRFTPPSLLLDQHVVSGLNVAIQTREKKIGILSAYSIEYQRFSHDDIHFLQSTANILAQGIERSHSDLSIRRSIYDKELLLRETHHRVRNNLQVIISLLNLQAAQEKDERFIQLLRDNQNRMLAMAMLHNHLSEAGKSSKITLDRYIESITGEIATVYDVKSKIQIEFHLEPLLLGVETALPCGLIVNELITNVFKHAFPETYKGNLNISLLPKSDGIWALRIQDNGIGLKEEFNSEKSGTLGFQLIQILAAQLKGNIDIERGDGCTASFTFPAES